MRKLMFWRSYVYRGAYHACRFVGLRIWANQFAHLELQDSIRVAQRFVP